MKPVDYEFISHLLHKRSGLVLTPDKAYLIESRLTPVARKYGHGTLEALIDALRRSAREDMLALVTEAMTTNETFFFRDKTPFDQFERVMMPAMSAARARSGRIRIWCAAASTGQEPYSLCMYLKENPELARDLKVDILATDISTQVLDKARNGVYTQFEVQRGLPVQRLVKHFQKDGENWRIKDELRSMVTFQEFNLLAPLNDLGTFDIIFCRNVLIYFDRATKKKILDGMARILAPDGFLVLGAAETMFGITEAFNLIEGERGLYASRSASQTGTRSAAQSPVKATA